MAEIAAGTEVKTDATAAVTTAATTDKGTAATTTAAAASTAATTVTAAADTTTAKPAWPEDWVTRLAKGDEKRINDFKKFQSPEAFADSYVNLRARMDSGEVRTALPKDPKPEQLAAWRKENGIPDAPDKYDLTGLAITETDKAVVGEFLKLAHGANMTPAQARTSIEAYSAQRTAEHQQRAAKDVEEQAAALDTLNQEWGGNFRRNMNVLTGTVLSKFPESVRSLVQEARLPDGTFLLNHVDAVRGLVALGLELNPLAIVAPAGNADLGKSAIDEYKDIQKQMRTNRNAYNKDQAMQVRFQELIEYLRKNDMIDAQGNEIVRKKAA